MRNFEDLGNKVSLEIVTIPSGIFLMSDVNGKPKQKLMVQEFCIGKYPVTQAQWQEISSRKDLQCDRELDPDPSFKGKNDPVEQVSWHEVVEFCQRLSKLTGREYRLPSEIEWEYAYSTGGKEL